MTDPRQIDVIAPNFKRRLSGVTSTIIRLVPLQARLIGIAATGPALPPEIPQIPLWRLPLLSRSGPSGARVWHARRNVEMLGGLALKYLLFKRLRLIFTSASQRHHTWLTRWLIGQMDDVIATSAKTAGYLTRPAHVIHHGIDTDTFCPAPDRAALRRALKLPETGPLIGCYGRIRAQKGTDVFVDAMAALIADHPDVTALVMGRATEKFTDFEQGLKDKVAALGLTGRILFLPEVPVWEMARWYQALDLYIAPQRWEGFGLTPLEAMACGVPCIATTVGAFEELIAPGHTGTLIAPGDVAAMTGAAANLLSDSDKLGAYGVNARQHVLDHFRLEQEAEAIIAVYRAQLARG